MYVPGAKGQGERNFFLLRLHANQFDLLFVVLQLV